MSNFFGCTCISSFMLQLSFNFYAYPNILSEYNEQDSTNHRKWNDYDSFHPNLPFVWSDTGEWNYKVEVKVPEYPYFREFCDMNNRQLSSPKPGRYAMKIVFEPTRFENDPPENWYATIALSAKTYCKSLIDFHINSFSLKKI